MATNPADLLTVAEYIAWTGETANTILNAEVQTWITQASVAIANYCQYTDGSMMALDRVEDCEGDCDSDGGLLLSARPINSVASITIDPYNTPISVLPADTYNKLGQSYLYIRRSSTYYKVWQGTIQVAYNAGFTVVPFSLKLAACLIVQTLEKLSSSDRDTVSEKVRDVEQTFNPIKWSIDDPVFIQSRELLNHYRITGCI